MTSTSSSSPFTVSNLVFARPICSMCRTADAAAVPRGAVRRHRAARHGRHQPSARGPDRPRHPQEGRQRCRCRHRHERGHRAHGADVVRHRRRSVRHRLGCQDAEALRPERQRPGAVEATLRVFADKGLKRFPTRGPLTGRCPVASMAGTSCGRSFGTMSLQGDSGTEHRVRRGRLPGARGDRWLLARCGSKLASDPGLRGDCFLPGRPRRRRDWATCSRTPAWPTVLSADRRQTAATPSTRARSPRTSSRSRTRIGGLFTRRTSPSTRPTWVEPVSTNYRGYDVWELPPQRARASPRLQMLNMLEALRPQEDGAELAGLLAPVRRGQEAGLRRPREVSTPIPAFAKVPVNELISKDYARRRRQADRPDEGR